jgi:uncharacterized protein (TIRG00374 family)
MRRFVNLFVSALLLALLYAVIDIEALISAIRRADLFWLAVGLLMVVPLTVATAWRFTLLAKDAQLGLGEANRLVLAASTLNLFLPSKLGDLGKAYVLSAKHGMNGERALSIVVFEKALDMASLLLWGACAVIYVGFSQREMALLALPVVGLLALVVMMILPLPAFPGLVRFCAARLPPRFASRLARFAEGSAALAVWFWQRRMRALGIVVLSIAVWGAHLFQFWLFTRAVGGAVPLIDNMAFATLSILVGLLPFTIAGIGSRDVAIVYFFSPYLGPGASAFLGILATLRYVLPAVAGIPFVGDITAAAAAQRMAHRVDATRPADKV